MRKLFKNLFIYLPLFLIFAIVLLYFIITSGFFLKFIGLPLAGTLIGMPIKVEKINVSFLVKPHLDVSGLTFGYSEKPFITGKKIYTRFDSLSLLKGDLKLENVSIDGLDINMASDRNGKWNVCWMNEPFSSETMENNSENTKITSSSAMQLDIAGASIRNINFTLDTKDDIKIVLKNFSIYSDSFKNLRESNVKIKGNIEQFSGKNVTISNGKVDTILKTNLNEEYFPTFLQLDSVISDFKGIIKGKAISNRSFKINALLNPEDKNIVNVSNISIKEYAGDTLYSSLVSKGKVTLAPFAFDLNINADPIGSDTINLVANSFLHTYMGNDVRLVFKSELSLANNLLITKGDLKLANLLLQSPVTSAKKDLFSAAFKYNIVADFSARKTDIKQLQLAVDQDGTAIINMSLKKPASIAWGSDQIKVTGEAPEIIAKVSDLKLSVFNELLPPGTECSSGVINSNLNLKLGANGSDISMFGNINLSDASYVSSNCNIKGVSLNQVINLTLSDMRYLSLKECCINLTQNGQQLLKSSFDGKYDLTFGDGDLKTSIPHFSLGIINILPDTVLSRQEKKQLMSKMSTFNLAINNNQGFNVKGKTITIKDFLLDLQIEKKESISVSLNKALKLDLNSKQLISEDLPLKVKVSNFELKNLNSFLTSDTKFQKGILNIKADAMVGKDFKTISASGVIIGSDINGNISDNILIKTGISTNFNIAYNQAGIFTLKDTIVKVLYDGSKDAANISVNGTLNKEGTANFETQVKGNECLLKALNKIGAADYEKIGAFLLDGSLKLKTTKDTFSIDGNINVPKLSVVNKQQSVQTEQINGSLDLSIYKNSHCLNINSAKLNIYSNKSNICDLTSSGKILFSDDAQSTLDMTSEKIDLEKILHIYGLLFPSVQELNKTKNKAATQSQVKEPTPIDLRGINLKGNINFNDIQYGPFIHTIINSNLIIKNNTIALLPVVIKMNQGELRSDIYVNPSFANGYTYEIKSQMKNMDINPLLKTFVEGDFSDTKGTISSLQFNAKGKGVTSPNLLNNLDGNLLATCNNISLPLDISKNKFLALFIMPIQIISNISQKLPNTPLPSDLNQAMNLAFNVMAQRKNINFQTGDIVLKMNNGVINIKKFYFSGRSDDIIKTMKFGGTIGPDNKLNLKTNTDFGKLNIPLDFYGTVEKPNPDIPAFIANFIAKNAASILDVTQKILNGVSGAQGSTEPVQKSGNVLEKILNNTSSAPQGGNAEQVQQLSDAIFDVAKGVLGNL